MGSPLVGKRVHYASHGSPPRADGSRAFPSECRAAVITEVDGTTQFAVSGGVQVPKVGLCVTNPTGLFFRSLADGGSTWSDAVATGRHPGGSWHWPEHDD